MAWFCKHKRCGFQSWKKAQRGNQQVQLRASRTQGLHELNLDVLFQFRQREKLKLLQSFISFFKKNAGNECYGSAGYTDMCVHYALKCKGKEMGKEVRKKRLHAPPTSSPACLGGHYIVITNHGEYLDKPARNATRWNKTDMLLPNHFTAEPRRGSQKLIQNTQHFTLAARKCSYIMQFHFGFSALERNSVPQMSSST